MRKRLLTGSLGALLAFGGVAQAQDPSARLDRAPLMNLLNEAGAAEPLEDAGINIFGHVEGSYTYNFDTPASETNFGRVFDFEHDDPTFNQFNITVERLIEVKKWDVGGRMEWIWGADAGLIHSNGLFDWYDSPRDPENQWDLNQLYVDIGVPVGNGLRIRVGKMVTLLGYETINPTTVPFYSRSYLFGFAIPFTHTGVMGTYQFNDNWIVEAGIFRGWEQSWEDNNDSLSYHAKLGYTSNDEKWGLIGQFVTGPEQPDNDDDWRTVLDLILTCAVSDELTLALNADYGWEANAAAGDDAQWYGLAGYAAYEFSDQVTFNGRAEWFHDDDGARIGVDGDFYELTVGLAWMPFPGDQWGKGLIIRPELRGDFSSEDVFDDGNEDQQFTAAIDLIYKF